MSDVDGQCRIRPYEGIRIVGVGDVSFGMTLLEIQAVLGPGKPMRRYHRDEHDWPNELYYQEKLGVRFDFDDSDRHCEFIEFLDPRQFPPIVDGRAIQGPTLREATELLIDLGYEPDEGAAEDVSEGRLGQDGAGSDSVDFPSIGLSLWTSLSTETDEGGELGEHVLDTVSLWRRGYWPDYS